MLTRLRSWQSLFDTCLLSTDHSWTCECHNAYSGRRLRQSSSNPTERRGDSLHASASRWGRPSYYSRTNGKFRRKSELSSGVERDRLSILFWSATFVDVQSGSVLVLLERQPSAFPNHSHNHGPDSEFLQLSNPLKPKDAGGPAA